MHPKVTKRLSGKLWHLEDTVKTKIAAESLRDHLKRTEEKKSRIVKTPNGYQVWWSK
jgi:hypothetical protein